MKTHVIIVAAGSGTRFGAEVPKQFCILGDRPVLMHTISNIGRCLPDADITLVLSPWGKEYWEELCRRHAFASPRVVLGGSTRWESVKNALSTVQDADVIMVHDGARPVVEAPMMQRIVASLQNGANAVIPVMPVSESLRQREADGSSHAVDRSSLVAVQTPQAFSAPQLIEAYHLPYRPEFTDDASVYEYAGFGTPCLVEGSPGNIKITHPKDIEIASLYLGTTQAI